MPIPRDPALDSTLAMLREGYNFIWNRCRRMGSDLFGCRIMGQRAVATHGPEAAANFYDEQKFRRKGAVPRRVITSLFGKNAIHTHDGATHQARKRAFVSLMTPGNLARLTELAAGEWRVAVRRWERAGTVNLFEESQRVLTRAICAWVGVPLAEDEVAVRARDCFRMIDAFGGVGLRLWRGKWARGRSESWIERMIRDVRAGRLAAGPETALGVMARLREAGGELLDSRTAAREVLNVIRPTVAISWYVVFAALALGEHPGCAERMREETSGETADLFMNEVRRFYPFAPYVGARVRNAFEWRGHAFEPGTLVLLDIYGLHHDPRVWADPDRFDPERFRGWAGDPYSFIPQGGGPLTNHRCPGEWLTMHNLTLAVQTLARGMTWRLAEGQDLSFSLRRMPTFPRSGVVLTDVRATGRLDEAVAGLPSGSAVAGEGENGGVVAGAEPEKLKSA